MLSVIWFVIFGFIIGLLARGLLPGRQPLGLLMTTVLGVAGSLIGGLVVSAIAHSPTHGFQPAGFIGSLLGALVLLWAYVRYSQHKRPQV
jgi:uncharacterized membrane protein YeaQ/YmgE (transglycosylase-associated protein family)